MRSFFEPHSVALIGAPRRTGPGAYNNLEMMLQYGYQGEIYVVHPAVRSILGRAAYPAVADIPDIPELAVISVGRDRVTPVFEECVRKGIRSIVIISQGFSDADERGKELQNQIVATARDRGVRVVGPNTMGILNAFAHFSTAFVDIPRQSAPPPLSMVVQSGVFQAGYESFTGHIGKAIDVGNCADVDFVDVLEYLEGDPQTRVIVLHMEGIPRGPRFLEAAARISLSKPIIVFKTGRSKAGAKAALSHTGSLAGEDAVFDAAVAKTGLIRVRNTIELRAVSRAFLHLPLMRGPRLGVVTATGACGIMAADACEDHGLELAPFPESIRSDIEDPRVRWHRLRNPVDLWPLGMVGGSFTEVFKRAVAGLLRDGNVDAVLGIVPALASPMHADLDITAAIREIGGDNPESKPLALWLYGDGAQERVRALESVPYAVCFDSIDEAVMGLAATLRYTRIREYRMQECHMPEERPAKPEGAALPESGVIAGEEALDFLRRYRIPVAPGAMAVDADAAASIAQAAGYPVVLKIVSPEWLHKSDLGGVRTGVNSEAELREAFDGLQNLFRQRTPDGTLTGVLVQKQMAGRELLLGIKRDPQLGPVLVAGMGGVFAEVFRDTVRSLAPIRPESAREMLRGLKIYPILEGIRGQEGVRIDCLADMLAGLSRIALDHPRIVEMDINPVMAGADGCWCADCRIITG